MEKVTHWTLTDGVWVSDPVQRRSGRRLLVTCPDDQPSRDLLEWLFEAVPGLHRWKAEDSFFYGYWPLRLASEDREHERLLERTSDGSDFVAYIRNAQAYWQTQHELCNRVGSPFAPPRLDQLVATDSGVMAGDEVQGVRYKAPKHMTGWYLTTDRYNGDASSLVLEHVVHITHARPDLASAISLAPGFRFWSGPPIEAWFDAKVAAESE